MMSGILSPEFLQAAGRPGKKQPIPPTPFSGIKLVSAFNDPVIDVISGSNIVVSSFKNGEKHTDTYATLSGQNLSITADENTEIIITGDITDIKLSDGDDVQFVYAEISRTNCTTIDFNSCFALKKAIINSNYSASIVYFSKDYLLSNVELSDNPNLTSIDFQDCYTIKEIDISESPLVDSLQLYYCMSLEKLIVGRNAVLSSMDVDNVDRVNYLLYGAENEDGSTYLAQIIENSVYTNGTVYTDSQGAYYSTIETAATAKGWTIEQL